MRLGLKQAHGAVLGAKVVVFGLIGSGRTCLWWVEGVLRAGTGCVVFIDVDGAGFLGG